MRALRFQSDLEVSVIVHNEPILLREPGVEASLFVIGSFDATLAETADWRQR